MLFKELNIIAPILQALEAEGYTQPTPIQEQSIPIVLAQKDLLGCAQTGTGKTAAFAVPILQLLSADPQPKGQKHIKTLILTPTRELAIQIGESFASYGKHLHIRKLVIFGGVPQGSQVTALRQGIDVLIATPGRLLDLMSQGFINLQNISIFVLDEADRMLDMGFIHDVKKVITKLPAKRQTLFFSATMPSEIQKLADTILTNPEKVAVTPVSSTVEIIEQSMFFVDRKDKKKLLAHLLEDKSVISALVFSRTKHGADKIVKDLHAAGVNAEAIHGNKSQNARQRALSNFKSGKTRVLVATDIAARGIDIDLLSHVINYDLPEVPETYVHRIGRTGRAGASGVSYSFCDNEEYDYLKQIQKVIGMQIPVNDTHPFPASSTGTVQIREPKGKETVRRPNSIPGRGGNNSFRPQRPKSNNHARPNNPGRSGDAARPSEPNRQSSSAPQPRKQSGHDDLRW